jgi:hypothetical protein
MTTTATNLAYLICKDKEQCSELSRLSSSWKSSVALKIHERSAFLDLISSGKLSLKWNFEQFFSNLQTSSLGQTFLFADVVSSTQTVLEKYVFCQALSPLCLCFHCLSYFPFRYCWNVGN